MNETEIVTELEDIRFERRKIRSAICAKAITLFCFQAILMVGVLHYAVWSDGYYKGFVQVSRLTVFMQCFLCCFIVHM